MAATLDQDALQRRLKFLLSRADAHATGKDQRSRQFSVTLRRDAAAVALMLNDADLAKGLLISAAATLGAQDDPRAIQLLNLAGERNEARIRAAVFVERFSRLYTRPHSGSAHRHPDNLTPRELLEIYKAFQNSAAEDPHLTVPFRLKSQLLQYEGYQLGLAQIPLGDYVQTFEALRGSYSENAQSLFRRLLAIAQRREDALAIARRDTFHWRRYLKPALILDFDIVELAIVSFDAADTLTPLAQAFSGTEDLTALPVRAAMLLRPNATPKFH